MTISLRPGETEEDAYNRRDEQFGTACDEAYEIFIAKNREYGDAISRTGLLGACVEISGIAARLEKLIIRNPSMNFDLEDEKVMKDVINALKDGHNYAVIGLMMLQDGNLRGS